MKTISLLILLICFWQEAMALNCSACEEHTRVFHGFNTKDADALKRLFPRASNSCKDWRTDTCREGSVCATFSVQDSTAYFKHDRSVAFSFTYKGCFPNITIPDNMASIRNGGCITNGAELVNWFVRVIRRPPGYKKSGLTKPSFCVCTTDYCNGSSSSSGMALLPGMLVCLLVKMVME